ncbi:hypothetical protein BFG07_00140 [Kosakonia cowanii]|nr:hypothetical protein BFG07_00140 [Kosakonia cowanii]
MHIIGMSVIEFFWVEKIIILLSMAFIRNKSLTVKCATTIQLSLCGAIRTFLNIFFKKSDRMFLQMRFMSLCLLR